MNVGYTGTMHVDRHIFGGGGEEIFVLEDIRAAAYIRCMIS